MAQYEMNLRDYWLIVRRRRMIIIVCTALVAISSFWFARQKVPQYTAMAAVKFEQSTTLSGLLVEVLAVSGADNIETQVSLIKSYPVLEEVARRMGKLPQTASGEAVRESRAYQASLDNLGGKIKASRVPSTSIIEIAVTSPNPREAREIANTVAEAYRDYNKANRNARVTEARKFIEAQLREVEGRVKRAEEEVWAFRDANRIIAPGAESTVLLSLFTQVRGDIEKTRQQRIELEGMQARLARNAAASLDDRIYVDSTNPSLAKLATTQSELMLERTNLALEVTGRHPRLQAIDDRLREVRAEMRREVAAQVAALRSREEILNRQMGELLAKNREVPATELSLQRLQRDAKVNDDLLTLLKTRHQEALIKESEGVEEVSLVRPATDPTAPTGAEAVNTVLVGALLGLMLGLVLAFVQETLDTSIGTIEDVESYLGVRVLGIVPHIDPRETMQRLLERRPGLAQVEPDALQSHALLITHFDPKSPVAEAYRTLRTNIQFERMERGGKVLVVTSPTLQEGKTTTIVNLALTMAQNGQKTLLIGANMRRPSIYRFFGIEREPGLSDILVGNAQWRDCVRGVADILMGRFEMEDVMAAPGLDNLHIIEAGPIPPNPSELLSTTAMTEFLRAVAAEYDIVLIDTPPILPVTDSAIVAGKADGVLLVYQAGKVGRLVLKRAKAHLEAARAQVWGVVLNDLQTEVSGYTYTHYYTHYYGEETPGESPRGGGGRVRRAVDQALGWFGRGRADAAVKGDDGAGLSVATLPPAAKAPPRDTSGRGRSRNLILALAALLGAVGALAAVLVWRSGGIDAMNPRELLRQRLGPSSTPTAPPRPGAPRSRVTTPPVTAPSSTPAASTPVTPTPVAPATTTPPSAEPTAPPAAPPSTSIMPPAVTLPSLTAPALAPPPAAPPASAPPPTAPMPSAPAPLASAIATPATPTPSARFTIEFGPFFSAAETERLERRLLEAGYSTVRSRRPTGSAVYAVLIERVPTAHEGKTVATALREQGLGEAVIVSTDPLVLRVGGPLPLRGAVELAERVRAAGHQVRVAAQPGQASAFVIRHGSFTSRDDAEAKRRELGQLDLPAHQVVPVP
jgi:polysaccharide biosynthesis transport protein